MRSTLLLLALLSASGAARDLPVILVFGDSLSAGYGLPRGKGWVDLLQQRLTENKLAYRVVNASVSGETTLGGRQRLPAALTQHRPAIVILELGANDGLRGQPVDAMRDNLNAMLEASQRAGARVLLIGMRIPPNYGPRYTEKFQSTYRDSARQHGVAYVPFLLDGFADRRELFQDDGIHPGEQAQPLILDNAWPALRPLLASGSRAR
jgi:acyl-CoA thioesterase-1